MPELATILKEALTIKHFTTTRTLHALIMPVTATILCVLSRDLLMAPSAVRESFLKAVGADRKVILLIKLAEREQLISALFALEALLVPLLAKGSHCNCRGGDTLAAKTAGRRCIGGNLHYTNSLFGAYALVDTVIRRCFLNNGRPTIAAEFAAGFILCATVATENHLSLSFFIDEK